MPTRTLTILQLNDLHGYIEPHPEVFHGAGGSRYRTCGGLARIATVFRNVRASRPGAVLALDNGDTFHGTYVAVQSRGEALVPLLNALQFDAMTAHWEFAYGPARFRELAARLAYPVLAINCYEQATGALVFAPTRVVERAGLRIGIVGICSNIVDKSMPASYSEGVRFTLGREELQAHVSRLRAVERVDLVIVLSHLGFPQDMQLAEDVPGLDVIVSGHTHNRLYSPARVGNTVLIQSGCHGSFVGRLDITLEGGGVTGIAHALIEIDERIDADGEMAERIDATMRPHRAMLDEPVGSLAGPLDRAYALESSMDNLLLDAIASAAGTQLAFSNGWRYGAPILPGTVTQEQLWNVVPTNPAVSTLELPGDGLRAMLEANLERTFSRDPYRQMGGFVKRCRGLNLYFKAENPAGQRIQRLVVEGVDLVPGRSYRVAMLGEQGVPLKYGSNRQQLGIHAVDALRQALSAGVNGLAPLRGSVMAV